MTQSKKLNQIAMEWPESDGTGFRQMMTQYSEYFESDVRKMIED